MMDILASVAGAEAMISGDWVLKLVGALFTGAALVVGRSWGKKEEREKNISIADQPVHVSTEERPQWVTRQTFDEHVQRMETSIDEIKDSLDSERGIARLANGNIHKRIDALSERVGDRLSKLEGLVVGVAETTGKLLDIALGKKPPNSRS